MNRRSGLDDYSSDFIRHWSPVSQPYAGCDQLLSLLDIGWLIEGEISFDEYWHGGARRILIYDFNLIMEREQLRIRVLHNPVVEQLVNVVDHTLVPRRLLGPTRRSSRARTH